MSKRTNLMSPPNVTSVAGKKQKARRVTGETAVVRTEHLSKRFGDLPAVDDLTFSLEREALTGFLGPDGAGKTTTPRMLLDLAEPTAERALVFVPKRRFSGPP